MHDCRDYHFLSYYCAIKTWHTHACTQDACSLVPRPLLKKIGEPEDEARMLAHLQYNNTVRPKISHWTKILPSPPTLALEILQRINFLPYASDAV